MEAVCALADLPDGSTLEVRRDGVAYVLVHHQGQLRAFRNRCPHWGIELNFQANVFFDVDAQFLQCANHGALFDPDSGFCVQGPCHGQSLEAVALNVRNGYIWLALAAAPAATPNCAPEAEK